MEETQLVFSPAAQDIFLHLSPALPGVVSCQLWGDTRPGPVSVARGGGGTRQLPGGGTGNRGKGGREPGRPRIEGGGWQNRGPGVGSNALGWRTAAVSSCHVLMSSAEIPWC